MELQTASATVTAGVLRNAEQNVGTASKLLKKAMDSDKNLVDTLLPATPHTGKVDIQA